MEHTLTRRHLARWLAGSALAGPMLPGNAMGAPAAAPPPEEPAATGSDIGSLYPFVKQQADQSRFELSYLHPQFHDLKAWKAQVREKVLYHLFYSPQPVQPDAQLVRRSEREGYVEEYLTFQTAPGVRVPAYVLIPDGLKQPAPALVALHDHGGFYLWGKEKLIESDQEHPSLTDFKTHAYSGKSIASELARQGYVVIVIDMFYWGERRMVLDDDPPAWKARSSDLTKEAVEQFNRRNGGSEDLVARSLMTAGITWAGVILRDDMRTVDYLASRPEVDKTRIGCVGLSVGGYRSFLLPALDERIRCAVDVGWMASFASQIKNHVRYSVGLSFHIPGLYRYVDLPDLAALIAPRPVLVINGSQDTLFSQPGLKEAYAKIGRIYEKAGAPEKQRCHLYDAPHEFNLEMQKEAWEWLKRGV